MPGAQNPGLCAEELGKAPHEPGTSLLRIIGGHRFPDHRPPGFGHGRILPIGRLRQIGRMSRNDESAGRSERPCERFYHCERSAANPSDLAERRVDEHHSSYAQIVQVPGQGFDRAELLCDRDRLAQDHLFDEPLDPGALSLLIAHPYACHRRTSSRLTGSDPGGRILHLSRGGPECVS